MRVRAKYRNSLGRFGACQSLASLLNLVARGISTAFPASDVRRGRDSQDKRDQYSAMTMTHGALGVFLLAEPVLPGEWMHARKAKALMLPQHRDRVGCSPPPPSVQYARPES